MAGLLPQKSAFRGERSHSGGKPTQLLGSSNRNGYSISCMNESRSAGPFPRRADSGPTWRFFLGGGGAQHEPVRREPRPEGGGKPAGPTPLPAHDAQRCLDPNKEE